MCLFDWILIILKGINFNLLCSTWLSGFVLQIWMPMLLRKFRVHWQQQQSSHNIWQRLVPCLQPRTRSEVPSLCGGEWERRKIFSCSFPNLCTKIMTLRRFLKLLTNNHRERHWKMWKYIYLHFQLNPSCKKINTLFLSDFCRFSFKPAYLRQVGIKRTFLRIKIYFSALEIENNSLKINNLVFVPCSIKHKETYPPERKLTHHMFNIFWVHTFDSGKNLQVFSWGQFIENYVLLWTQAYARNLKNGHYDTDNRTSKIWLVSYCGLKSIDDYAKDGGPGEVWTFVSGKL